MTTPTDAYAWTMAHARFDCGQDAEAAAECMQAARNIYHDELRAQIAAAFARGDEQNRQIEAGLAQGWLL